MLKKILGILLAIGSIPAFICVLVNLKTGLTVFGMIVAGVLTVVGTVVALSTKE